MDGSNPCPSLTWTPGDTCSVRGHRRRRLRYSVPKLSLERASQAAVLDRVDAVAGWPRRRSVTVVEVVTSSPCFSPRCSVTVVAPSTLRPTRVRRPTFVEPLPQRCPRAASPSTSTPRTDHGGGGCWKRRWGEREAQWIAENTRSERSWQWSSFATKSGDERIPLPQYDPVRITSKTDQMPMYIHYTL